ncbi:uncharacterized protein LOC114517011 [Dendronephthya gigantea]|uniref:uncharacterized protein LOC114517011 n=1 Tax=Dendronephthya gigantea TaxID=151771 RepID=UPI00106CF9EC|nr:uncharacterized protein LOC114517011 [Dendronephthya gigantea]
MPQVSGFDYVKSWAGLLKIAEFFTLLIAFSCLADFSNKSENNGSFKFFLFVTITAWLITMFLFCIFASGVQDRVSINWTFAMTIYSATVVFLLVISTSLVAEKARKFRRSVRKVDSIFVDTCDVYDKKGVPCRNVEAAVVFGFLAAALFITDAAFYFMEHRTTTAGSGDDQAG